MKSAGLPKHLLIAFVLATILYFGAYGLMEHFRTHNGLWQVTFLSNGGANAPTLIINEPQLNIHDFHLTFPTQTAPATNATLTFDHARDVPFDVPFGRCVFLDAMSQPGTVTFTMFGHEIQLIPRTLTVDKNDYDWHATNSLVIRP